MKLDSSLLDFGYSVAGALFGVGVVYATIRERLRKQGNDINGLGRKYGRLIALLILWADSEEKRKQLAHTVEPQ